MSFSKIMKREIEVAFTRHSQPIWFRILKYVLLIVTFYFFRQEKLFWIILCIGFASGLVLHLWYRSKTQGWTKSYGLWKHEESKSKKELKN